MHLQLFWIVDRETIDAESYESPRKYTTAIADILFACTKLANSVAPRLR